MKRRVDPDTSTADARDFWTAAAMMLGLRFHWSAIKHWFAGITIMRESSTYQAILAEGRAEGRAEGSIAEARKVLARLGRLRFGVLDEAARDRLEAITDLDRLELLAEKLFIATSWDDLLADR